MINNPTPYPEINHLLRELYVGVREILGEQLVGMYLDGSLVIGDFDRESDVDFVAVTEGEIAEETFLRLQEMHDRLSQMDTVWAIQLEGSYLSRQAIRRFDPRYILYPNIERGKGERLKITDHGWEWDTHRWVLREHGIALAGPPPQTLIDPVGAEDLREAMRALLAGWATKLLEEPERMKGFGYQPYIVLSMCRALYTLTFGRVVSKARAAEWAQESLDGRWRSVVARAWAGRLNPGSEPSPEIVEETVEFIRYVMERSREFQG